MSIKVLIFLSFLIFSFACLFWTFKLEPNLVEIKHYHLNDQQLSGLRIVFASDFHIGKKDIKRLKRIVKIIKEQKGDLILLGGDYLNGHTEQSTMPPERIAAELGNLTAPYGVVGVLGNHDWYINGSKTKKALQNAGITILENQNRIINYNNKQITIAGVADKSTRIADSEKALNNTPKPRILLTHTPDIFPEITDSVNLVLAGHTHGGQVKVPFIGALLVPSDYGRRFAEGFFDENGVKMIVSKGLGTSMIPIRFNCKPEIVVIEFE